MRRAGDGGRPRLRFRRDKHHLGAGRHAGQLRRRDARAYGRHSDLYALSEVAALSLVTVAMLFSSYTFLSQFLPAVVLAFAAARRHSPRAGILVLAGASLFFYGAWKPVYLLLLLARIGANFSLGLLMENPDRRGAVGSLGVALNLALLCYFK